jgi:hypothetical protein
MIPSKIFWQGDSSVSIYMQCAKSLFDELVAAGYPMSLEDFNLYMFCGLRGEFKDLVMSLITKAKPLSYADLHSHLLIHEFLHKKSLQSMDATAFISVAAATFAANTTTLCSSCYVSSQLKLQP